MNLLPLLVDHVGDFDMESMSSKNLINTKRVLKDVNFFSLLNLDNSI